MYGDALTRPDTHTLQYDNGVTPYPLNTEAPTAMIIKDVTIIRGPGEKGYPFLEIRPKVTLIAVAAQNQPSIINDDDEILYGLPDEKMQMKIRIKVLC